MNNNSLNTLIDNWIMDMTNFGMPQVREHLNGRAPLPNVSAFKYGELYDVQKYRAYKYVIECVQKYRACPESSLYMRSVVNALAYWYRVASKNEFIRHVAPKIMSNNAFIHVARVFSQRTK